MTIEISKVGFEEHLVVTTVLQYDVMWSVFDATMKNKLECGKVVVILGKASKLVKQTVQKTIVIEDK